MDEARTHSDRAVETPIAAPVALAFVSDAAGLGVFGAGLGASFSLGIKMRNASGDVDAAALCPPSAHSTARNWSASLDVRAGVPEQPAKARTSHRNTVGTIAWTRISVPIYTGTLSQSKQVVINMLDLEMKHAQHRLVSERADLVRQ